MWKPKKMISEHPYLEVFAIHRRLREWREQQQKKLSTVALNLDVSAAAWAHWETGTRFPNGKNLLQLSAYTGIPMHELICPFSKLCPLCLVNGKNNDRKSPLPPVETIK